MEQPQDLERPFFPDIETLFSEYLEFYGGKVVEKLSENKTDRKNADFLFEQPEIIAELKTFEKDVFSGPEEFPRIAELLAKWTENGMMSDEEFAGFSMRGEPLPKECMEEVIQRAAKTVERVIYKANKQIEETKKTFGKENANGIIFLINDGNYFFRHEGFLKVIADIFGRKFKESSFDVIVYLTVNQATFKEDSELDYNVWIPIYSKVDEHGETIVSDEFHAFVNSFGEKFLNEFLTLKTGHALQDHNKIEALEEGIDELKKHNYIPKSEIYKK